LKRKLRLDAADPRGMPTIILFERGSVDLRAGYRDALRRHVLYLQAFDHGADFVLRGHANLRTNEPGAVGLSNRRAQAVADCLRSLGVAAKNLKILAQGSSYGLDVEMGGARPLKWNRRVEIVIKPFDL
jgi:outer membrane protein OmpA-like peptidoglycan-associated protein